MVNRQLGAGLLAVAAVVLSATTLLSRRESAYSVLVGTQRSPANADRYAESRFGVHTSPETHKLAVHKGTDYGDEKVFAADQVFGQGDSFGDHNHFGKGTRFAAATRFGDDNTFGAGSVIPGAARFGPSNHFGAQVMIGAMATLGAGAKLEAGAVVGEDTAFGPQAEVGKDAVLAGGVIFSGGDHFGEGIHFGPNTRFGPNTVFDGAEIFSKGCTFGDNTRFNNAKAGKDVFEGGHYFGEGIHWGGNDPLPPHPSAVEEVPPPPQPYRAGSAAPSADAGLPPGYSKTAIPGVYQYTAPAAEAEAGPARVEWQWNHPSAAPLQRAGLAAAPPPSAGALEAQSAGAQRARAAVLGRLRATAGEETRARAADRREAQSEAHAHAALEGWLRAHPRAATAAPAASLAAHPAPRVRTLRSAAEHLRAVPRDPRAAAAPSKFDGFQDNMVRVTGSALHPQAEGHAQSVFDDMF